jgi:hypothetical protein
MFSFPAKMMMNMILYEAKKPWDERPWEPHSSGRGEAFGMRIMPGRPLEKLCGGGVGRRISASAWDFGMENGPNWDGPHRFL